MVVAPESVTADVAQRWIFQGRGKSGVSRQIVHPHADHAQRAGQQFVRTCTHHAVARHPLHLAVILFIQPRLQFRLAGGEIGIGNTYLLKAELVAPPFDILR